MIPLFGDPMADGKRLVLEGRLIPVARQAPRPGTSVVLDFGLWGRDGWPALRWPARSAGAACQVVYLPAAKGVQLARIAHRQATAPHASLAAEVRSRTEVCPEMAASWQRPGRGIPRFRNRVGPLAFPRR
jgi:predicted kinase